MWTSDIETKVFSRVKNEGTSALKQTFPIIFYTAENESDSEPVFPTVFVQELPGLERGNTLDGTEINAVLASFQVDISDNKSKARVKQVMNQTVNTMKSMRFEVTSMPTYRTENGIYIGTARFRRMIGALDIL